MASEEPKWRSAESRIMQTLASLATRKPLRMLQAFCEGRERVSARQLDVMLTEAGCDLADYAFTLRQDFDAMRQRVELLEGLLTEVRQRCPLPDWARSRIDTALSTWRQAHTPSTLPASSAEE